MPPVGGKAASAGAPSGLPTGVRRDPISIDCGPNRCESAPLAGGAFYIEPCCVPYDACGLHFDLLDARGVRFVGACQAKRQPGEPDATCPSVDYSALTIEGMTVRLDPLPGCCRAEGTCGVVIDQLIAGGGKLSLGRVDLGCVDWRASSNSPAQTCIARGSPAEGVGGESAGGARN